MTAIQYCTTKQVFDYLKLSRHYYRDNSNSLDNFGTGNGSTTIFYLSKNFIIDTTYHIYYGATESAALSQELTETTHYTIDIDEGKITLTAAGVTLVDTNNLYADYYYTLENSDSRVSDLIDRMTEDIDHELRRTWQPSTDVVDEEHIGKGYYDRKYRVKNLPLLNVTAFKVSTTPMGQVPVFVTLTDQQEYEVNTNTGLITLLHNRITNDGVYIGKYPRKPVPNRVRISYSYGASSVDKDIVQLCILMTAKAMYDASILNALDRGTNGFESAGIDSINAEINRIMKSKMVILADGF